MAGRNFCRPSAKAENRKSLWDGLDVCIYADLPGLITQKLQINS